MKMTPAMNVVFSTFLFYFTIRSITFTAQFINICPFNDGNALELWGSYLVWKNKNGWAIMSSKSHDNRLSRLSTIHQRDGQTDDSDVAIANYAPTQYASNGKNCIKVSKNSSKSLLTPMQNNKTVIY